MSYNCIVSVKVVRLLLMSIRLVTNKRFTVQLFDMS